MAIAPLNQTQQSALDLMTTTLNAWGLSGLVNDLKQLIISGDTQSDTLSLALSQTDAYKQRFAGNELRKAQGLPELTPAQYIATEEQYRNVLQSYGLPAGFYDQHEDFTQFIGNDISASELSTRAKIAHDQYENAPTEVKQLWGDYFGTKGDAIAAILDPTKATQLIQDQADQVAIGGAAALQGLRVSQGRAQRFQQNGVTLSQAQKAYQDIAAGLGSETGILNRFGGGATPDQAQGLLEDSMLLGSGDAAQKLQNANNSEVGLFKGGTGGNPESLGVSQSY